MNQTVIKSILVSLLIAGTLTIAGIAVSAAEKGSSSKDAAVERTRHIALKLCQRPKHMENELAATGGCIDGLL